MCVIIYILYAGNFGVINITYEHLKVWHKMPSYKYCQTLCKCQFFLCSSNDMKLFILYKV